jgi:anthranilate synthase/aminodeoxychorismate synthase-like glutamine amidotransferase
MLGGRRVILVIDNYDSFTFNLVQYLQILGATTHVVRNDAITLAGIESLSPERILISPGPCSPDQAGMSLAIIERFSGELPILGVCLGHQTIGQAMGGRIVRAGRIMHGKTSPISHQNFGVFRDLPSPFHATRYHSLVIERSSLPDTLEITAESDDGEIMGIRHKHHPTEGVQFHPESILTTEGLHLLENWITP